jgi:hypothetical protein
VKYIYIVLRRAGGLANQGEGWRREDRVPPGPGAEEKKGPNRNNDKIWSLQEPPRHVTPMDIPTLVKTSKVIKQLLIIFNRES